MGIRKYKLAGKLENELDRYFYYLEVRCRSWGWSNALYSEEFIYFWPWGKAANVIGKKAIWIK